MRRHCLYLLIAVLVTLLPACRRSAYRKRADHEVGHILQNQMVHRPWESSPADYNIQPAPNSRLYDPSPIDCPILPDPYPRLYAYEVPELPSRAECFPEFAPPTPESPANGEESLEAVDPVQRLPDPSTEFQLPEPDKSEGEVVQTSWQPEAEQDPQPPQAEPGIPPAPTPPAGPDATAKGSENTESDIGLPIQPIPKSYWDSLPQNCISRILAFDTIVEEYERQFQRKPGEELQNKAKKLGLEEIVYVAMLNSREYQAEKERLYRAALALTLERFDYMTKFSTTNNGVDANYTHLRNNGITVDTLAVPSTVQMDKMFARGGTLLARFANDVVLTFNGAEGFAADVSSELLVNFTQEVLQRDILLEPLVQSERNVIYAARSYARFRRLFYLQLANEYYNLLLRYRRIEIQAQTYFSLVRAFEQAIAEVAAGIQNAPPQIQVDQTEQSLLNGRSTLISQCNALEQALDSFKLTLGLPTEVAIDVKLEELLQLTLRDQVEVAAERAQRWRNRLTSILNSSRANDRGVILNSTIFLIDRLLEWQKVRRELQQEVGDSTRLRSLFVTLQVEDARLALKQPAFELEQVLGAKPPSPRILVFQRRVDVIRVLLRLVQRQIQLARALGKPQEQVELAEQELARLNAGYDALIERVEPALSSKEANAINDLTDDSKKLIDDIQRAVKTLDELNGEPETERPEAELLAKSIEVANEVIARSGELLDQGPPAIPEINIDVDAAMLTALTQRLDLMNQRGTLHDDLRAVKLAVDELRSFLNLNASHVIRTRNNRPFEFDIDNSRTTVNVSLDLPLNRRAQRNSYRNALINYQASRRSLMAQEDNIKFDVRSDLRTLELIRVQYPIAVTQAALAAERVISTRLSLALGVSGVLARDLLDALSDSQSALSDVAASRISYITTRAQLAVDLEVLLLDERGLWPNIDSEEYQPESMPFFQPEAGDPYTEVTPWVKLTPRMRRVLRARQH